MKKFIEAAAKKWFTLAWKDKIAGAFTNSSSFSGDKLNTLVGLFINAMQHGNRERRGARVTVSMVFKGDTLHIAVTDSGTGITELPPKPDIVRIIENLDPATGFGTFIIKQLADKVEFNEMTDGGHMVKMAIRLQT